MEKKWTVKYPTRPGWYWLKNFTVKGYHIEVPGPTIVLMRRNLIFNLIGDYTDFNKWDLLSAEWYGPIEAPE